MNRSKWKPFYDFNNYLYEKSYNYAQFVRRCVVLKQHIGLNVPVHGGFNYRQILIKKRMVGTKYGQLMLTKARVIHQLKKKKTK